MSPRTHKTAAAFTCLALAAAASTGCSTATSAPAVSAPPAPAAEAASPAPTIEGTTEPIDVIETTPITVDEYVAMMTTAPTEWSDAAGAQDEYSAAAAVFPLPLPEGWAFPAASVFADAPDDEVDTRYQSGFGSGEVYFFWRAATALAAHSAHLDGDEATAAYYLDVLTEGFQTPITALHYEDPDGLFLDAVEKARNGTYGPLRQFSVNAYVDNPGFRAVAEAAGDF